MKRTEPVRKLPRGVKYAWGVGVTVLLASALLMDRQSPWLPLVNQAIDIIQQQSGPSPNK